MRTQAEPGHEEYFFMLSRSFICIVLLLTTSHAFAQFPTPQLNSIFPCGARQGTDVECTIAGGDLTGATGLYFSHSGIRAESAGPNKFRVFVDGKVPVGRYDVRVVCPLGVSSCRSFLVGDRVEFVEKEPNSTIEQSQRVTLPVTINGQVQGGIDLDFFTFTAKRGQRVIINAWASRIDSRLDSTLMLFDPRGKEIGYGGDYYGKDALIDFTATEDGDYTIKIWDFIFASGSELFYRLEIGSLPHLDAIVPAAVVPGESTTVTLYGRNLPGGQAAPPSMNILGRPLEMISQTITVDSDPVKALSLHTAEAIRPPQALLDGIDYRLVTPDGASNALFVGYTSDRIVLEREPNNSADSAQSITAPVEISGTFSPVGDLDYYKFTAKKNDKLVLEVYGERQSGLVDSIISGFDAQGKRLTSMDDAGKNIGQLRFTTTTRDARWEFSAPADGDYTVQVRDLYHQQRGDPRFTYRLSIRQPQPDFRIVAVPTAEVLPDTPVVRQGGRYWVDVLAYRDDGFDELITIAAENLPKGVTCEPVVMGRGKQSVPLVFTAATDAPLGHAEIKIVAKSKIDDKDVVRVARGGSLVWSTVNTPGIARMADTIVLAVRESAPFTLTATPTAKTVTAGEMLPIQVKLSRAADWNEDVQLAGFDLPNNATLPLVMVNKGSSDGKVELTVPANTKPGPYSFTINGSGQVPRYYPIEREPSKRGNNIRGVVPSNVVTIEVLAAAAK